MEPLYAAAPSYSGVLVDAAAAGDSLAADPAGAEAAPHHGLRSAAVVLQQQPQSAAVSGGAAAFPSCYAPPVEAAGVVASVCALPAAAPSAFMPLQQQQLRNSSRTSTGRSSTSYNSGALLGSTGPADVCYRSSFAASTYSIPGSITSLYRSFPAVSAVVPPAATATSTASTALPAVGFGPPSTPPPEAGGARGPVVLGEAVSYGAASAGRGSSVVSPPMSVGAAAIPSGTAGTTVDIAAADIPMTVGLPSRVSVECLSTEECGLLRQTRRLLQEGISNTFDCITLLSGVLLSRGASPLIHHLLQAWEEAGQQQQSDEKMLCLLYVMNDALQKCRRRGCPYLLLLALEPLYRFCCKIGKQHESILQSCTRVIRILKDAKAFGPPTHRCSSQIADALLAALQGNGTAAQLPPAAVVQKVLEGSAEEASNEAGMFLAAQQQSLRQPGQQQEDTAGIEIVEGKVEKKQQIQRLLHTPPGGTAGGGRRGKAGSVLAAGDSYQQLQHKVGGGVSGTGLLRGGSVFLQQARISGNMRTLPAAIDTFLLQYPVPGDEALAAHINENFSSDPQEAALRQQISDALGSLAAGQTALADKAIARRRVEERLRELQHEQQRLRERAERVQRAAAGGAQAQLLLWQQMQQELQQGGERIDFSPEGIAAEQERLANLLKAAHAKLRVLLKTEWNRRVELQAMLLSLAQAIEERLDVILPLHVHCREVKSVIDRAALLQANRRQRRQRQERAEEEQRQQYQQTEDQQQQQPQGREELQQQGQETQAPEVQRWHEVQEKVVAQGKGDSQREEPAQQEAQLEEKEHQLRQFKGLQEAVMVHSEKKEEEACKQESRQLNQQLHTGDPAESQAVQHQARGMLAFQHADEQHEGVSVYAENDIQGEDTVSEIAEATQQDDEQGHVEEERQALEEPFFISLNDDEVPHTEESYSEMQLLHEHADHEAEQEEFEQQPEDQPFEHQEEHDGWLV